MKSTMRHKFAGFGIGVFFSLISISAAQVAGDETRSVSQEELEKSLQKILTDNPRPIDGEQISSIQTWSERADALFFLGRFQEAVKEYEQMLAIDPRLRKSHWRLGIAYFFNDQPDKAVQIFEGYHSYDDVDRENGIWRFLSQHKASDAATARKELLRYKKDDRQPFPSVYRLFDGTMTEQQVVESIPADASQVVREQRTFYIRLYCGMLSVVKKENTQAVEHLKLAVACEWPRKAGYGPNYMWHVARVQMNLLTNKNN